MAEPTILTHYECIVHASNRHASYGHPVTVFASNVQEAINRAVAIGWHGNPRDAHVLVKKVEDVVVQQAAEEATDA